VLDDRIQILYAVDIGHRGHPYSDSKARRNLVAGTLKGLKQGEVTKQLSPHDLVSFRDLSAGPSLELSHQLQQVLAGAASFGHVTVINLSHCY
jgi:hypothetical protein